MVQDPLEDLPEPRQLRLLRRLITLLIVVLIVGVITIVGLLVIRLAQTPRAVTLELPESVDVPQNEVVEAVTVAKAWIIVVTRSNTGAVRARLFDAQTGRLQDVVAIGN
ncbi:MAG: DUF6476 family protein [Pseudomonadota bacterium]